MMNMYKQTIYISLLVSVLSFSLALFSWIKNSRWGDFLSNVCIGVFCSICIVIITVYIQYKSEFKRLFSYEASLLRELYISLLFLKESDICSMRKETRCELANKIENNFSELIRNAREMDCIERKYKRDISKVTKDILGIYVSFVRDYNAYPGVTLQLLKKNEYLDIISEDIELVSLSKSDKKISGILNR